MKIANKLATVGAAVLSLGAVLFGMPTAIHATGVQAPKVIALEENSNDAATVNTELDCSTHTVTAKVTNNLGNNIAPRVTFNNDQPNMVGLPTIEPGKTGNYYYSYSGNNLLMNVKVAVDGYDSLEVSPTLYCSEPISFKVTASSQSAVTGMLTNNSSLVAQTILTRANDGDIRTESLAPGESRLIALPFTPYKGENMAFITIGTATGYQGTYSVDLTKQIIPLG